MWCLLVARDHEIWTHCDPTKIWPPQSYGNREDDMRRQITAVHQVLGNSGKGVTFSCKGKFPW
jgi:hypothetical protein